MYRFQLSLPKVFHKANAPGYRNIKIRYKGHIGHALTLNLVGSGSHGTGQFDTHDVLDGYFVSTELVTLCPLFFDVQLALKPRATFLVSGILPQYQANHQVQRGKKVCHTVVVLVVSGKSGRFGG